MEIMETSGHEVATTEPAASLPLDRVVVAPSSMQHPPEDAPDALVIDLDRMVDVDPLRLCRETVRRSPATAVIGLGPADRLGDGFQLLRLGAVSWITADKVEGPAFDQAVTSTLKGESVLAGRHAAWIMADFATMSATVATHDPRRNLTATEREVLTRLAKHQSPQEIAAFHDVHAHLVNRHVRFALHRLHRHR